MLPKSRLRGLGYEHRPLYLWPERQDDCNEEEPFVSSLPAQTFVTQMFARNSDDHANYFTSCDPHHDMSGRIFEQIFSAC